MNYLPNIIDHYKKSFGNEFEEYQLDAGPVHKLPVDFRILEFPPSGHKHNWTYATLGMSIGDSSLPIELFICSNKQYDDLVELLTAVAYYHLNTAAVNLNHTVNFGRPWQDASICQHGFISLPYLDGPELENLQLPQGKVIKFYWLIPVTQQEVAYKKQHGIEKLEELFETKELDYLNPKRRSLV